MKFNTIINLTIVAVSLIVTITYTGKLNQSEAKIKTAESNLKQAKDINADLLKANKSLAELATTFRSDLITLANEYQLLHGKYTNLQNISSVKIENFK